LCGWTAVAIGLLVLLGWQYDIDVLKRVRPGLVAMNPSTALGLIGLGLSVWILDHPAFGRLTRSLGRVIALIVAGSGMAKLGDHLLGWRSGVDMLLFPDDVQFIGQLAGLMAPNTALSFALLGISLALQGARGRGWRRLARWTAYLALTAAMINLAGHALHVASLSQMAERAPMALHTAVTIALLCIGRLAINPHEGLATVVISDGPGGRLFRQLAPVAIVLPLVLGWLELWGEESGVFGNAMGIAALAVTLAVALVTVTAAYAHTLDRQDAERRQSQAILAAALNEAQASTRAKSTFLANMSHELRTPLNSVIGFADLLEDGLSGPLNPQQQDFVSTIGRNGRHLLRLINDLLDQAKVESGTLALELAPLDLVATIQEVVLDLRPQAVAKRIDTQTSQEPGLARVVADHGRIRQVLVNLIGNALKFTPDGGTVQIQVAAAPDRVAVTVRDTGIGIDPADHERIFRMFEQVDGSHSRPQEGTGLGLPLARSIVELHGGSLSVESSLGHGSAFTFTLPVSRQST
jgi:signal transduction histidine kinase